MSALCQDGETAAVAVRISRRRIPAAARTHRKTGTGPNGGILSEDGPTFLCTLGWDWIPAIRDRDIGIWQKVSSPPPGPSRCGIQW